MPPKKATGSDTASISGLSETEFRFIKAIFDNMTQKPDADWDKVAGDLGLKDAKCAKERFRQMSVRHGWRPSAQAAAPGSSLGKGKKGKDVTSPSGDGKVTKKPRGRTPKKAVVKKDESEDDDEKKSEEDDDVKMGVKSEDEDGVPF
ncbi:uncharacterized protein TrAtP1_000420 [Trichoderma atroviride]|uniref:Myb-like domain-containing protein n=1 Tax=Hypocrea atroviridis (strain ATCC 20476 / IMI 206040) TaxID=452589 RepID=G9NJC5_HYPAI|nr:uncharacterized protein TRIATDRAFT_255059 [Trichoderma atroviride IMI 206040]EHK48999.1 hypothetical protein TRIATDRAFT_255059 [Trichoderma atroviride IMI 206040]UKZ59102.1 hypothetical protein TrAtP1_000420 [Trichoderma atroviride]